MRNIDSDKLIAEFMGATFHESKNYFDELEQLVSFSETSTRPPRCLMTSFFLSDLKYHSSWDWLIPVCQKLDNNHDYGEFIGDYIELCNAMDDIVALYTISNLYDIVVDFIIWHNKTIQKLNK